MKEKGELLTIMQPKFAVERNFYFIITSKRYQNICKIRY